MWTRAIAAAAMVTAVACGGAVEQPAPAGEADAGPTAYTREDREQIPRTTPGETASVSVSCEHGETVDGAGCDVSDGATVVQSASTGLGWTCAVTSGSDQATVHVWVRCTR